MRQVVLVIFLFVSLVVCGQRTEQVVVHYPNSNYVKEVYYVLKSDKEFKHGDYFHFFKGELASNNVKSKGFYKKELGIKVRGQFSYNMMDGNWIYYLEPSSTKRLEEGNYSKSKKLGIWTTYLEDGKVKKQFDFDENIELPTVVKVQWRYPSEARRNHVAGMVKIKVIYENCLAIDYEIIEDIGYGCGDVVIESLKEKQFLERKYGVEISKSNCDKKEEVLEVRFKLN
jgi:hypothetical protein